MKRKLDIWSMPKPTNTMVWAVCPYLRKQLDCGRCPAWETDKDYGKCKRGCRALAEEACGIVEAGRVRKYTKPKPSNPQHAKPKSEGA